MKIFNYFLFLMLFMPSAWAAKGDYDIKIVSATWSGKSVQTEAGQFCDGKERCGYRISPKFIGEAVNVEDKSFSIRWTCGAKPEVHELSKAHDATNTDLDLICEVPAEELALRSWDPRSPLKYSSSFHSMMMENRNNLVQRMAGEACTVAIQQHLQNGKNFYSDVMRRRFVMRLEDFPVGAAKDLMFYHYTKSNKVIDIAKKESYDALFSHPKKSKNEHSINTQNWFFYVAGDTSSSAQWGHIRMDVRFSRRTLVLINGGDMPGEPYSFVQVNQMIEDELVAANAELESCRFTPKTSREKGILMLLAAEADEVGLIAYYGINNRFESAHSGNQWMETLGPWAIRDMKVGKVGKAH